ncbi:MAG: two-component system response regulator [Magnetococcales bacterium]|nr:two-component system response regulator [Magnetococcales bacterium]MBF0114328.1 two-component system response regulator [Magnetococcales bacterium]
MVDSLTTRQTILIVDDTPANVTLLANLLRESYRVKVANNGFRALELAKSAPPDLILLDIMMPEMDGYEVCRRLKATAETKRTPVIFLTAKIAIEDEELGFAVGAIDFIHKPISPAIVIARVRAHLESKSWQNFLEDRNGLLQKEVEKRLAEVHHLRDALMFSMISLAEFRDECTGNHILRTQEYVRLLAERLAQRPSHSTLLTPPFIADLVKSAPLHDIGKIAIPDHILMKPGKLTAAEFEIMKSHAARGHEILKRSGQFLGEQASFLSMAMDIALYHQEWWNGSGYPEGLAGQRIPLSARLMAVADVYDALCSVRPYKRAMTHVQAVVILQEGSGRHFDPELIDVFLELSQEFVEVASRWPEHSSGAETP